MPKKPTPTEETYERDRNRLVMQCAFLHYLPQWLRHRGLNQRKLAEALGVSEGSVSKWKNGIDLMPGWAFMEIVNLLRASSTELKSPPPTDENVRSMTDLSESVAVLTPEQVAHLAQTARLMAGSNRK